MFCTYCGCKLADKANFCTKCGKKVADNNMVYTNEQLNNNTNTFNQSNENISSKYSVYEVFDYSNTVNSKVRSITKKIFKPAPTITPKEDVYRYIITDKSIIIDNAEYTCDQLKISRNVFSVNGKSFSLYRKTFGFGDLSQISQISKDSFRWSYALAILNGNIEHNTLKDKLGYIASAFSFLCHAKSYATKTLNIPYDNTPVYKILWNEYRGKLVKNDSMTEHQIDVIKKFENVQNIMNNYLQKENIFFESDFTYIPYHLYTIAEIADDSDTDMISVLIRFKAKLAAEEAKRKREMEESNYRANFSCPANCRFLYNDGLIVKCKISASIFKSPNPYSCGYGINNN